MKRLHWAVLAALALRAGPACAQVAISISSTSAYGYNVVPGSQRRLFASVVNGTTNGVTWSVAAQTGGATATLAPSASGNYVDVTLGAVGASCGISGAMGGYTITAPAQVTIQAQSQDDPTKISTAAINVCAGPVQIWTVPFYTTLYSGQSADVQSYVWGNADVNVSWSITAQPAGGDGRLSDSNNRDAVFSATVAGRYTLTATSATDPSKTASTTVFVTGHSMPYRVTPQATMPVDCTADPQMTGTVYEVGPSQTYHTIASVIGAVTLTAGTTIRIHNEDGTGTNPTRYHEYWNLNGQGTPTQPIRVCGVPDSQGNLPIIDGTNATTYASFGTFWPGYALVSIRGGGYQYYPNFSGPEYVILEGLNIQNAFQTGNYTPPGGSPTAWPYYAMCIRVQNGDNIVVRGNVATNCAEGLFTDFNATQMWGGLNADILWEGNSIYNNGDPGNYSYHNAYLQSWRQVVQFNSFSSYRAGAGGSNLKSRGVGDIIRYNYFGDGGARENDLVDNEDADGYMIVDSFLGAPGNTNCVYSAHCLGDQYSINQLAAAYEAWHTHIVYGNIYKNSMAARPIHFYEDHDQGQGQRVGTLWWYNNTFYQLPGYYSWDLFDLDDGGDGFPHTEWQAIQAHNNIVWQDNITSPYFAWSNERTLFMTFGANLVHAGWTNNVETCTDNSGGQCYYTGWPYAIPPDAYMDGSDLPAHLSGVSNIATAASIPFVDTTTWAAKPGTPPSSALPAAIQNMPVRFQFAPGVGYPVARSATPLIGAVDGASGVSLTSVSVSPSSASVAIGGTKQMSAACVFSDSSQQDCTGLVTWASASPSIASIANGGFLTGVKSGTTTVTASESGISGSAYVSVATYTYIRLSWDFANPAQAVVVLETTDPSFPTSSPLTAQISLPAGLHGIAFASMGSSASPWRYDAVVSSNTFAAQDYFYASASMVSSVTVGAQSFNAVFLHGDIDPSLGGLILEAAGQAQVAIGPGQVSQGAQITINPEPADVGGARAAALAHQGLVSLGPGRDILFVSSGTLTSASLTLPFDATLLPGGQSSALRVAYFDPNTSMWRFVGSPSVSGGLVTVGVTHFSLYKPVAVVTSAAPPGFNAAIVYPAPAVVPADPKIRFCPGVVDSVDVTIFDVAGRVVNSATVAGGAAFTPATGVGAGQSCYEYVWTGRKASGAYFAVIQAKGSGTTAKAKLKFAVVR